MNAGDNVSRMQRGSRVRAVLIAGIVAAVILAGLGGWLGYRAHQAAVSQQLRQLLVQTAREGSANLMTIDYRNAEADVQRILDSATGEFYADFRGRAQPLVDVVTKARSVSTATVTEAGVESVDGRRGQVLIAVTVNTAAEGLPPAEPRFWRMRLTVSAEGTGTAKIARVEFVQ